VLWGGDSEKQGVGGTRGGGGVVGGCSGEGGGGGRRKRGAKGGNAGKLSVCPAMGVGCLWLCEVWVMGCSETRQGKKSAGKNSRGGGGGKGGALLRRE